MAPSTLHLPPEKHLKCYGCIEKADPLTLPRRVELCLLPAVLASLQKNKPSSGGRANSTIQQGSEPWFDLQLDAQNSCLFTYNTFIKILYMFRALPCSSSGGVRPNCIYAATGMVTLCR
jgi:hypothetical protein